MKWKRFEREKPPKSGKYLISYTVKRKDWREAIWKGADKKFVDTTSDSYGPHSLRDPVWWVEVL